MVVTSNTNLVEEIPTSNLNENQECAFHLLPQSQRNIKILKTASSTYLNEVDDAPKTFTKLLLIKELH